MDTAPPGKYPDLHWGKRCCGDLSGLSLRIRKHRAWGGSESTYGGVYLWRNLPMAPGRYHCAPKVSLLISAEINARLVAHRQRHHPVRPGRPFRPAIYRR
jgi:hypothetical protein